MSKLEIDYEYWSLEELKEEKDRLSETILIIEGVIEKAKTDKSIFNINYDEDWMRRAKGALKINYYKKYKCKEYIKEKKQKVNNIFPVDEEILKLREIIKGHKRKFNSFQYACRKTLNEEEYLKVKEFYQTLKLKEKDYVYQED